MLRLIMIIAIAVSVLFAAENKRCSLISNSCLNIKDFDGKTVTYPEYVTRFNKEGLTFCSPSTELVTKKNIAILYMIDQSNSMSINHISAGDPYNKRGTAVLAAINRQKELFPHSLAGVVEFHSTLKPMFQKELGALSDFTHYTSLMTNISSKKGYGTRYDTAFVKAEKYLNAVNDSNYTKFVIFITDGEPTPDTEYQIAFVKGLLAKNFPETHTFFLGDTTKIGESQAKLMKTMAELTGGVYHPIQTQDSTALIATLLNLVTEISSRENKTIKTVSMSRTSFTTTIANSNSTTVTASNDTVFEATFNRELPFTIGENVINVTVDYALSKSDTFSFTIVIDSTIKSADTINLFNLSCTEKTALEFTDSTGTPVSFYSKNNSNLYTLITPEKNSALLNTISVFTQSSGDSLKSVLNNTLQNHSATAYFGSIPFTSNWKSIHKHNDTLETREIDSIIGYWVHPNDPRDFSIDTVYVFITTEVITISLDSGKSSTITIDLNTPIANGSSTDVSVTLSNGEAITITLDSTGKGEFHSSEELYTEFLTFDNTPVTLITTHTDINKQTTIDTLTTLIQIITKTDSATLKEKEIDNKSDSVQTNYSADTTSIFIPTGFLKFDIKMESSIINYNDRSLSDQTQTESTYSPREFKTTIVDNNNDVFEFKSDKSTFIPISYSHVKSHINPTLVTTITLPSYNTLLPPDVITAIEEKHEKHPSLWTTTLDIKAQFFDHTGQYIIGKSGNLVIPSNRLIAIDSVITLFFEWLPDVEDGSLQLTSQSNRNIQTGVIICIIESNVYATLSEEYYNLKKGYTLTNRSKSSAAFGYIRDR